MKYSIAYCLFPCLLILAGCKEHEEEYGEYIYRRANERLYEAPLPLAMSLPTYPWNDRYMGSLPRLTKEFFRCRGSSLHPMLEQKREGKESFFHRDCPGGERHGLPLREGEEYIYPILIDLLNYVQEKTRRRVVITCGHRCPQHNTYADWSPSNWGSRHMLGAEVDFYVEGMESEPGRIVALLQEYYKGKGEAYSTFLRYESEKTSVSTFPWYNKEVFIKLNLENEGRDGDNRHPFPYVTIQVRYDRQEEKKVVFDPKAVQNYLRY